MSSVAGGRLCRRCLILASAALALTAAGRAATGGLRRRFAPGLPPSSPLVVGRASWCGSFLRLAAVAVVVVVVSCDRAVRCRWLLTRALRCTYGIAPAAAAVAESSPRPGSSSSLDHCISAAGSLLPPVRLRRRAPGRM